MDNHITLKNISKHYNHQPVLDNLSLEIQGGQITALFGPNGCGKSTLLNILAGIIKPTGGTYCINNFDHFRFSYMFQNYRASLLNWSKNIDNISLPLSIQHQKKSLISKRVRDLQKSFGFNFDLKAYPYELSGGQQQILSFFRAIITEPTLLFVDEPFSALDYEYNIRLRTMLLDYYLKLKPTIVLVTHNIEEAVHLSSRIVVLSSQPTRAAKVIENPLRYPRDLEMLKTSQFHHLKDEVLSVFQEVSYLK